MRKFTSQILSFFVALCLAGLAPVSSAFALSLNDSAAQLPNLTSAYFPIFPLGAGDTVAPELLPVVSNYTLDGSHSGITHAVIIIPDYTRDARANAAMIASLAGSDAATTFILAPQFLLETDMPRLASSLQDQTKMLARWPLDGWVAGGDTLSASSQKPISSFTALDLILLYLGDKKLFPDLQYVTLAGHGMGGDFVQRYAASGQAPDILDTQHIGVRFLVANASSYLYFTAPRFLMNKPGDKPSLGTPDAAQCAAYNSYPYGLDDLNVYVKRVGASAVKLRYITRTVTYLTGEKAAEGDALADNSCSALLQGPNRVARMSAYTMYLTVTFGDAASKLQKFVSVPKAGYEPAPLFGSPCGLSVLFGDGECR